MSSPVDSLQRDTEAFSDGSDKKAMREALEILRQAQSGDSAFREFQRLEQRSIEAQRQKREERQRTKPRLLLAVVGLICVYVPAQALLSGSVKNIFVNVDWFSPSEFPYVFWSSEPYLFSILVALYCLPIFVPVFALLGFNDERTIRPTSRAEYDRLIAQAKTDG
jgi:hypothetical protein